MPQSSCLPSGCNIPSTCGLQFYIYNLAKENLPDEHVDHECPHLEVDQIKQKGDDVVAVIHTQGCQRRNTRVDQERECHYEVPSQDRQQQRQS